MRVAATACGTTATGAVMHHSQWQWNGQEAKQRKLAAAAKRKEDDVKFEHQMQS